ncbi:MAG: PAS domain-containing sensor histidine kinase [Pseudomonas sp.]|uniref:sensor histidine kinase n=1 Tax=Pseudomonas sp. TaxID=306 RepID=UPI0039820B82
MPLSASNDHFRLVVDAAPTGIVMVDPHGTIVLVNRHLLGLFGYAEAELLGQPIELLLPQSVRATHPGKVRAFFNNPSVRSMGAGRDLYATRRDGEEFPVEIGLTPVDTEDGPHVLATIVDITERKTAEKQIARSRDQFNAVVEASPTGIVMVDENARITLVNYKIESLFGYSRHDLIGQPIEVLLPARMRFGHPEKVRSFFTNPTSRAMGAGRDLYAARFDGTEFPVEIGLNPIDLFDGRQVMATIVDITERKKVELKLLSANEGLEQFVYVASHDLRSPLRGIADLLEWIKEDIQETPNEKAVKNIERAQLRVERLEYLIADLLKYARAGSADAEISRIDVRDLVARIFELQPLPAGFDVKLNIEPLIMHAARTPIDTVLRNLIANAVKHHDRNEGMLTVGVCDKGKFIEFSVGDDGPGIPEHAQQRIFKLFQTASSSERQGSGVGLAVSKRLTEAHGGWITVESKTGLRGATFRVSWPNTQPGKQGD